MPRKVLAFFQSFGVRSSGRARRKRAGVGTLTVDIGLEIAAPPGMARRKRSRNMDEQQNALDEREAAKYLGVSSGVLRLWRAQGTGPRYYRAGSKLIRYRRRDLDGWIEERLSDHTSVVKDETKVT
jgi:predicted DNA-binding transcriptional regulator AlpA